MQSSVSKPHGNGHSLTVVAAQDIHRNMDDKPSQYSLASFNLYSLERTLQEIFQRIRSSAVLGTLSQGMQAACPRSRPRWNAVAAPAIGALDAKGWRAEKVDRKSFDTTWEIVNSTAWLQVLEDLLIFLCINTSRFSEPKIARRRLKECCRQDLHTGISL